jgi:hypothetical protein
LKRSSASGDGLYSYSKEKSEFMARIQPDALWWRGTKIF